MPLIYRTRDPHAAAYFGVVREHANIRYHGILAPAAKRRREVDRTAPPPHSLPNYSWAALLKRIFDVEALKRPDCEAQMRILAAIEDPDVIVRILTQLGINATPAEPAPSRAGNLFAPAYRTRARYGPGPDEVDGAACALGSERALLMRRCARSSLEVSTPRRGA